MANAKDRRKNNSRPVLPDGEKKIPVTIYKKEKDIKLLGGKAQVKEDLSTVFDEMVVEKM